VRSSMPCARWRKSDERAASGGSIWTSALPSAPRGITVSYGMASLTIRLPLGLRRELEKLSKERRRAAGDIVRESLRRYLAVERFRALRDKTLPFAEAQGLLTDEDVFKSVS